MATFVKKPEQIEAIQFDATYTVMGQIEHLVGLENVTGKSYHPGWGTCDSLSIRTVNGTVHLAKGDWVTRGVRGEVDVYGPDHFDASFDLIGRITESTERDDR